MRSEERKRGDDWADVLRGRGCWVVKLPGSSLAGVPDWLVVEPGLGIRLVEAKVRNHGRNAFVPSQCTGAQRFFLRNVSAFGGDARVLILDVEHWAEIPVEPDGVRVVEAWEFAVVAEGY